jgi:CCR4-NOT transcriptional regulation complex NOT5 subunit
MLTLLTVLLVVLSVALIAIGLWPGPWTIEIRSERANDDRIQGIKEAIEVLQQELDYLEAPEQDARIERLASSLSTLAERAAAMPSTQVAPHSAS